MKQLYLTLLLLISTSLTVSAHRTGEVVLKDVHVGKAGNELTVSFKAEIGKKAARNNYKLVLTPVVYKGSRADVLKPIVVYTRKSRIIERREQISAGKRAVNKGSEYRATNRSVVNYAFTLPYEEWMNGASLKLERTYCGCCSEESVAPLMLAADMSLVPPAPVVVAEEQPKPQVQPFKWEFSRKDMIIDFVMGKTDIHLDLFENRQILAEIVAAIEKIQATRDASIDRIEIVGYASPEGKRDANSQLANARSIALKEYIKKHIQGLGDTKFDLINGGENWKRLREMVAASDMASKNRVLYIIDHVPAEIDLINNTSRKKQLMDLEGGEPYRYMMKHFFPNLRNACYIGVYYSSPESLH